MTASLLEASVQELNRRIDSAQEQRETNRALIEKAAADPAAVLVDPQHAGTLKSLADAELGCVEQLQRVVSSAAAAGPAVAASLLIRQQDAGSEVPPLPQLLDALATHENPDLVAGAATGTKGLLEAMRPALQAAGDEAAVDAVCDAVDALSNAGVLDDALSMVTDSLDVTVPEDALRVLNAVVEMLETVFGFPLSEDVLKRLAVGVAAVPCSAVQAVATPATPPTLSAAEHQANVALATPCLNKALWIVRKVVTLEFPELPAMLPVDQAALLCASVGRAVDSLATSYLTPYPSGPAAPSTESNGEDNGPVPVDVLEEAPEVVDVASAVLVTVLEAASGAAAAVAPEVTKILCGWLGASVPKDIIYVDVAGAKSFAHKLRAAAMKVLQPLLLANPSAVLQLFNAGFLGVSGPLLKSLNSRDVAARRSRTAKRTREGTEKVEDDSDVSLLPTTRELAEFLMLLTQVVTVSQAVAAVTANAPSVGGGKTASVIQRLKAKLGKDTPSFVLLSELSAEHASDMVRDFAKDLMAKLEKK